MKKAVLVTGGTVGSGLAIAERFAKEGYDVFITSRDASRAGAAADRVAERYGVFAKGYGLDIRSEQAVKDIFTDDDEKPQNSVTCNQNDNELNLENLVSAFEKTAEIKPHSTDNIRSL